MSSGLSGFGGQGYVSQESRALSTIADTPGADLSQGQEQQIKMLQSHEYQIKFLAGQMKQAQQGINEANQNPIQQIQQFVADIIILLGGGELAEGALDFGDLQYILPALGALFGFGEGPFPISLFEAAEKFFLGYVVPQQQFVDVINHLIEGWLNVFGIDKKFVSDVKALVTAVGDLFDGVENLFPSLNELFGSLGINGANLGPLGQLISPIINFFTGLDLKNIGNLVEFITDAIDPFITGLTSVINWVNSILAVFGFHGGVVNSPLGDSTNPFANLFSFFGGVNFNAANFDPIGAAVTFITNILSPTGMLAKLVNGFISALNIPGLDASKIVSGFFHDDLLPGLSTIRDAIFNAFHPGEDIVGATIAQITAALRNIPSINILGFGGALSIPATFQNILDQLWSGLMRVTSGGKSIADVANAASATSAQADTAEQLAVWNNAVLGIRNNKSIMSGIDETEESTYLISDLIGASDPPSFPVTATSSPIGFWRASETAKKGFISWFGRNFTNITALYVDVYKLDPATNTLVFHHSSANLIGSVVAGWSYLVYNMAPADRIDVVAGDVLGISIRVIGTGTHTIGGKQAPWMPNHPTAIPARPAAVRAGGTSDISMSNITYSGNFPWFGIGILTGDVPPPYQAPRTTVFNTPGAFTYPIPEWATAIDVIMVGAGGGGHGGNGGTSVTGRGGQAGSWATETLVRGVDFPSDATQLTGAVGAGGNAGGREGTGTAGGATQRDAFSSGKAATAAAGGAAGTGYGDAGGASPGNATYMGTTYIGGSTTGYTGNDGDAGASPGSGGGGGQGGIYTVAWGGGPGGPGSAWLVARQQ